MINFSGVRQVAIVVDDLEATIKTYTEKFGCVNWIRFQVVPEDLVKFPHIVRGKPRDVGFKGAKTKIGELEFEFFETISGETIYKEYIDTQPRKKGIQHISFNTDDFPATAEALCQQYEVLQEAETPTGMKVMLFDSYEELGYSIEIAYILPK